MNSTIIKELDNHRSKEIQVLGEILAQLKHAKRELSNDLTRLAMKNLPLLVQNEEIVATSYSPGHTPTNSSEQVVEEAEVAVSAQTSDVSTNQAQQLQELEPLELDI